MISLLAVGLTLDFLGTFILASLVLIVHQRVKREKRIDEEVIRDMNREKILGMFSLLCLLLGYMIEVYALVTS